MLEESYYLEFGKNMSKIGKLPVKIKEGVNVNLDNGTIKVSGSKGSMMFIIPEDINVVLDNGNVLVSQKNKEDRNSKSLFGLTRVVISNMIKGVSEGFSKKLELSGVGYRAQVSGNDLVLSVGFSHTVKMKAPEEIQFSVAENIITVSGIDKTLVGDVAAKIRAIRPPEPYKGKGIKYLGEKIRRKAGKAAKAVGTK